MKQTTEAPQRSQRPGRRPSGRDYGLGRKRAMTKGMKGGNGADRGMTRRSVLQAGIGAAGLAATGRIAFPNPAIAQAAGFDWKRFKGEHLEVLMAKGPRGDLLQQ